MSDILYLKAERGVKVNKQDIKIQDIAHIECTDIAIKNRVKELTIVHLTTKKDYKFVISVLKVIEAIHSIFPELEINNVGECDMVIEYIDKKENIIWEYLKIILICVIVFVGAAFTIMTFNNDVAIEKLFDEFYYWVMNEESSGYTILEISYSIGLGVGILVFYNHIGGKRFTTDPTPIQVEMRIYEEDVNTALVKNYTREDKRIDVS